MSPRPTYAAGPESRVPSGPRNRIPWNDVWRAVDDDVESRRDEVTGLWRSVQDRIERMDR